MRSEKQKKEVYLFLDLMHTLHKSAAVLSIGYHLKKGGTDVFFSDVSKILAMAFSFLISLHTFKKLTG